MVHNRKSRIVFATNSELRLNLKDKKKDHGQMAVEGVNDIAAVGISAFVQMFAIHGVNNITAIGIATLVNVLPVQSV